MLIKLSILSIINNLINLIDSTLYIHVYGKEVDMKDIGLPSNKAKSIEELENIIKYIDKVRVCERSVSINKYKNIQSTFGSQFVQSYDHWRHINCTIILDNGNER